MKQVFNFFLIIVLLLGCTSNTDDCNRKKNIYQPFYYVFQEVNPKTEQIKLVKKNVNLTSLEVEILRNILERRKVDFKVTIDSMILISCKDVNNIEDMVSYSSELFNSLEEKNIIPKDSTLWYYSR